MKTKSLGFIGGGRITRIILQAFVNKKAIFESISVFDTNPEVLQALKQQFPFIEALQSSTDVAKKDVVFLALHPPVILSALEEIRSVVTSETLLISLAPKITIDKMASLVPARIVRMLPNATSIINHAWNPVSFAPQIGEIQKWYILEMLNLLGVAFETEEEKLEAYALVSAMLPTYFWFQWTEIETLGRQFGLTPSESRQAIYETLNAALNTWYHSGMTAAELMNLIAVKPIGDSEEIIKGIYQEKLVDLWEKIKP
jgi:pyrroline-5-carboxylate reductase